MTGKWEIKHSILIGFVESSKTSLEDEMVEEFMHGQHAPTAINQPLHLHQTELVESVCPDIEGVPLLGYDLTQTIIEGSA